MMVAALLTQVVLVVVVVQVVVVAFAADGRVWLVAASSTQVVNVVCWSGPST